MQRPDLTTLACVNADFQHVGCLGRGMCWPFLSIVYNEENLIRRAGIYALSGWLDDHGRMTDKISCTESH